MKRITYQDLDSEYGVKYRFSRIYRQYILSGIKYRLNWLKRKSKDIIKNSSLILMKNNWNT